MKIRGNTVGTTMSPDRIAERIGGGGGGGGEDTIVAQGTSGGWNYRKWASGFAECWLYESTTIQSSEWTELTTGVFGAGYIPNNGYYPFSFTAAPAEIAVVHTKFMNQPIISQSISPAFSIMCGSYRAIYVGTPPSMNLSIGISIYASGRWE